MLMTWTEFVAFLTASVRDLVETEYEQVRYGDVGMALVLTVVVALALFLTLSRIALWRRRNSRHHSGHAIDPSHQQRIWIRVVHAIPKVLIAGALAFDSLGRRRPVLDSN